MVGDLRNFYSGAALEKKREIVGLYISALILCYFTLENIVLLMTLHLASVATG